MVDRCEDAVLSDRPDEHGPTSDDGNTRRQDCPRWPPAPPRQLFERHALPEWGSTAQGEVGGTWRAGYVWAREGRHDLAWAWWRRRGSRGRAAQVQASRAATLRVFGLHDRATVEDRVGLLRVSAAPVGQRQLVEVSLRVGLVADAVGTSQLALSRRRLVDAERAADSLPRSCAGDRQRIRLSWVKAEVVLLAGDSADSQLLSSLPTLADGQVKVPEPYRAGTGYHCAKGLLFAGVLERRRELLETAAALAPPGLAWAIHLARRDLGVRGAEHRAQRAYGAVVAPPHLRRVVPAHLFG